MQWSDQGMLSSYKFVQKLFTLNEKIKSIKNNDKTKPSLELSKFINQYLLKIEKNLSNFSYNVIIANIHEAYAFLYQLSKKELNYENLTEDYIKFLVSISPVVPHLSSECLNQLNINKYEWPEINEEFLIEENVSVVVQFNGKKRGIIDIKKDSPEEDLVKEIFESKTFDKYLKNNTIKKQIYVRNRLINFLI